MIEVAKVFKALADENRLKILVLLINRKFCAKGISKYLEITKSATSQHLKILTETGIIIGEKKGKYMIYSIKTDIFKQSTLFLQTLSNSSSADTQDNLSSLLKWEIPNKCDYDCQKINRCCKNTSTTEA